MTDTYFHGVDHITIGVQSLPQAAETYSRLGFSLTPKGTLDGQGGCNHCIMMEGGYLELAAPAADDEGQPSPELETALKQSGDGVKSVCFTTHDGASLSQELRNSGWTVSEPEAVYRNMVTADGQKVRAGASMVRFPDGTLEGFAAAAIQHLTPEVLRQPDWLQHPNGVLATTSLTLIVDDPLVAKAAYEKLFGAGVAAITDSTVAIHLGNHRIFLCEKDQLTQLHPDLEFDELPALPAVVAMGLKVKDLNATEQILKTNGVNYFRLKEGMIRVPPSETHGTLLEFSEED